MIDWETPTGALVDFVYQWPHPRNVYVAGSWGFGLDSRRGETPCITLSPSFPIVVLHQEVLETALTFVHDVRARGPLPNPIPNKTYRLAAYRQFTYWVHGHLGKHVRRVVPACVITKIRDRFPEPDGRYVGFLEAEGVVWPF